MVFAHNHECNPLHFILKGFNRIVLALECGDGSCPAPVDEWELILYLYHHHPPAFAPVTEGNLEPAKFLLGSQLKGHSAT